MLGLVIGAVLMLIMDINRPQRGRLNIGVESLVRVAETMAVKGPHERNRKGILKKKERIITGQQEVHDD